MIKIVSLFMLVYFVTENNGKSIKIQIDCDDILKILAGLTNQDYRIDRPIEITKLIAQVDKNGKIIGNPYHPEDSTEEIFKATSPNDSDKTSQWEVKKEIDLDLMKAEIDKKLDRENHNFIASPVPISEDELEEIDDTSKTTTKTSNKLDIFTEDYLQKLLQKKMDSKSKLQDGEKHARLDRERKQEIDAVAIENNAVHVEKDADTKDFDLQQKRFQLKKGAEEDKSDQMRIDYTPPKIGKDVSDEERSKKPADIQDFKDFQRRFILVDGPEVTKRNY